MRNKQIQYIEMLPPRCKNMQPSKYKREDVVYVTTTRADTVRCPLWGFYIYIMYYAGARRVSRRPE